MTALSSACSKQAHRTGLWLEAREHEASSLQSCRGRSLGSCVNLAAQGLGWISRQLLQMRCEHEQLGGSVAQGRDQDAPAEKPICPIGSPWALPSATCILMVQWSKCRWAEEFSRAAAF